jgi:predicted transcriptional regulator
LARLETYGWLKKIKQGRNLYYSAAHGEDEAVDGLVGDISKRVFNGSNIKLMKYLLDTQGVTKEEIDAMRRMLDKYKEE